MVDSSPFTTPWSGIDVAQLIAARSHAIELALSLTVVRSERTIRAAVAELAHWIKNRLVVRVIGAGRALLAASIPGNRLLHAGAIVYIWNPVDPLPNTAWGGGIIASSASGKTPAVLEILREARTSNPEIRIIGLADYSAQAFASLCDCFIGIYTEEGKRLNPLSIWADTAEYVISGLLDAMVVAAGRLAGTNWFHEDLGPKGPEYDPITRIV